MCTIAEVGISDFVSIIFLLNEIEFQHSVLPHVDTCALAAQEGCIGYLTSNIRYHVGNIKLETLILLIIRKT